MSSRLSRNVLILTISYGDGHNAAARALAEEFEQRGFDVHIDDIYSHASPFSYGLTQDFYSFCVRKSGWIWGLSYEQAALADWTKIVRGPLLRPAVLELRKQIEERAPSIVICTYPIFAYMLDLLKAQGLLACPYVVVVTDALEVARLWLRAHPDLLCVTDEYTRDDLLQRFVLDESKLIVSSFPVESRFYPDLSLSPPSADDFKIIYAAFASLSRVFSDINALLDKYPRLELTVLADTRYQEITDYYKNAPQVARGSLQIIARTSTMENLMRSKHLYIGKGGAATMFEAYMSATPLIINYALPGQEQGNLDLLLRDACGLAVDNTVEMMQSLDAMLASNASQWHSMRQAMLTLPRREGRKRIVDAAEALC